MSTEKQVNAEAEEVIARLGGNARAAELCGVTRGAVSQWLTNGIPRTQRRYLRAVRPDVFAPAKSRRATSGDEALSIK